MKARYIVLSSGDDDIVQLVRPTYKSGPQEPKGDTFFVLCYNEMIPYIHTKKAEDTTHNKYDTTSAYSEIVVEIMFKVLSIIRDRIRAHF